MSPKASGGMIEAGTLVVRYLTGFSSRYRHSQNAFPLRMTINRGCLDCLSTYPPMPNAWRLYRGPVHSRFTAAFSWPTTLVLSCAGTNPENPKPYSGSSEILNSHFRVLNIARTSPTTSKVLVGMFEPVPTVAG